MNKKLLILSLLLVSVGFAVVATNLFINGSTTINVNNDDFRVYYSNVLVNGKQDMSVVESDTKILFNTELRNLGEEYILEYDVTNASKNYDAELEMTCTTGNEYLSVINEFDDETILNARDTRRGKLTLELIKSYTGSGLDVNISCDIKANAVERNTLVDTEVPDPVEPGRKYPYGKKITLLSEDFNVINETEEDVVLLAQYNVSNDYRQTKENNYVWFAQNYFWPTPTGPMELDVQQYAEIARTYVSGYQKYFTDYFGEGNVTADLVTLQDLKRLECVISEDYTTYDNYARCDNSPYKDWLVNGQKWWTRSASPTYVRYVWFVNDDGLLYARNYTTNIGVRPMITISKELLEKYLYGI